MNLRSDHRPTVDAEAARTSSVIWALAESIEFSRRTALDGWLATTAATASAMPDFLAREGEDGAIALAQRLLARIPTIPRYGGEWPYAGASAVQMTRAILDALGDRPIAPWIWAELFTAIPSHKKVTAAQLGALGRTFGVLAVPAIREAIRRKASFRSTLFNYLITDGLLTEEEALIGITDPPLRHDAERYLAGRLDSVQQRLQDMLPEASKGTRETIIRLLRRIDKRIDAAGGDLGELEIRLRDDPEDQETAQVWADLLMEQGDPRGQQIALQIALANEADPTRALAISDELATHTATFRKAWFGKPGGFPFTDKYLGRSHIGFGTTYRALMRGKPPKIFDRVMAFVTEVTDGVRPRVLVADPTDQRALTDADVAHFDDQAFRSYCIKAVAVLQLNFKLTWPGTKIPLPYQERGHYPDGELRSSLKIYLGTGKLELALLFPFELATEDGFVQVYQALVETLGKIVLTPTGFYTSMPTADGKKMKRKNARYAGPSS